MRPRGCSASLDLRPNWFHLLRVPASAPRTYRKDQLLPQNRTFARQRAVTLACEGSPCPHVRTGSPCPYVRKGPSSRWLSRRPPQRERRDQRVRLAKHFRKSVARNRSPARPQGLKQIHPESLREIRGLVRGCFPRPARTP